MTKKDYTRIAAEIKESRKVCSKNNYDGLAVNAALVALTDLTLRLARITAEDNPRFDRRRFLDAAGAGL